MDKNTEEKVVVLGLFLICIIAFFHYHSYWAGVGAFIAFLIVID